MQWENETTKTTKVTKQDEIAMAPFVVTNSFAGAAADLEF